MIVCIFQKWNNRNKEYDNKTKENLARQYEQRLAIQVVAWSSFNMNAAYSQDRITHVAIAITQQVTKKCQNLKRIMKRRTHLKMFSIR